MLRAVKIVGSLILLHGCLALAIQAGDRKETRHPDVIVILCDDLGYADASCYGGKIKTPHIDRLALNGMRFTDAHSTSSVCSPTRYGLLTGRYNWRTKLQRGVLGGLSPALIDAERLTIASMFRERGYRTACFGKWHLGMNWVILPGKDVSELQIESRDQVFNVDFSQPIQQGPTAVGFEEYFGISASLDMVPFTFIENDRVTRLPTADRDFPLMWNRSPERRTRKGPAAPEFETEHVLPEITKRTVAYIQQKTSSPNPYFIYVPFASPHTPIAPTPEWQNRSGLNPYADFVMQTDSAIGEIVAAVEKGGRANQTLMIVTSDNGCSPQARFAELAVHGHHPSGPLRGHKADIYEGGTRVPFVVSWPDAVKAGSVSHDLVCQSDLMATFADIIGVNLPETAGEDSFSFLPILKSSGKNSRDHLVSHSINGSFAMRRGSWKLIFCADSGGWSAPRPGSPQAKSLSGMQLYHLSDDLAEQRNVVADHPEIVRQLTALLEKLIDDGRSTPGARQRNDVPINYRAHLMMK